jgi:PAS domain S-box-containing protein
LVSGLAFAQLLSPEELTSAAQIRQLTPDEAGRHYPVRLHGVITFFNQGQFFRFIQDDTAGIYFYLPDSTNNPTLTAGQLVELTGTTSPGEYAPIVSVNQIRVLGPGTFPAAKPVSYEDLASGEEDSQFVEISGVVRAVTFDPQTEYYSLEIGTGDGRCTALTGQLPVLNAADLVDSSIKIRGVSVSRFNLQRQLFDGRLLVPRPEDIVVESPAPADPYSVPARPMEELMQFAPRGSYGHRVKVTGTVIYRQNNSTLYVQDKTEGLCVETRQSGKLSPGDQVEVLGFPAKGEYTPLLQDAVFRKIGDAPAPVPDNVTADQALSGKHDCRLVRIEATVLDRTRYSREQFLVLQANGFLFNAYLDRTNRSLDFASLRNGCKVAITGVCLIELGSDWHYGADWRAKSFRIMMRSPADISILQQPSPWNFQLLLWAVGVLAAIVLLAFVWVAVLRRQVHQQTGIIQSRLQVEAALKARYESLFENANDMVFTHDLKGKITSINDMGERLLQRRREEIVGHNLIEFMADDQRSAVQRWLEQIVHGAEPNAEWDFINSAGQKIKLEISSRLLEQNLDEPEIEGIARDITERRRLERELLEISNREQRRIGHDLHDGVCQQLAAIAYLVSILGDQLQEKNLPEHAEADRIGKLINEANVQARNVAHGLFPSRLDEHGLLLALEDLAVNASSRYRIACQFVSETAPFKLDGETELHLYYIVQEALLNAINHGKSTVVTITLATVGEQLKLTVQDNGRGFQMNERRPGGMGIRIMKYRAKVVGAVLNLISEPALGTQVAVLFSPSRGKH